MVKYACLLLIFQLIPLFLIAQPWISNQYEIRIEKDSIYGSAIDFSGKIQSLRCDIAYPVNDIIPDCGRPVIILVHGGSFLSGSKEDYSVNIWLSEFAKKGYVAAAINYRLGMYQTPDFVSCGVENWGCLNMSDSAEWHRASYRGMQDCKGAIRYLISKKDHYNINKDAVFLIGESAGGFIALQAAFLDMESEISATCRELPDVLRPAANYQATCIPPESLDIENMLLSRPDLGSLDGDLNTEYADYKIKGVASVYGGIFSDILEKDLATESLPALYLYAQPNDLIVPFRRDKVMSGLSACAVQYSGCPPLKNTPNVFGNKAIHEIILQKSAQGMEVPDFKADFTENTADCLLQVLFPALSGHAMDDIWLRTSSIAQFFAAKIEALDCNVNANNIMYRHGVTIYPNPVGSFFNVMNAGSEILELTLIDLSGVVHGIYKQPSDKIDVQTLFPGIYIVEIKTNAGTSVHRISKL